MRLSIILLLCALSAVSLAANKVYKWVDNEGNTHYSETKPDNQQATTMDMPSAKAPSSPQAEESPQAPQTDNAAVDEDQEADPAAKAKAKADLAAADRINHQKLCEQAKANRLALNSSVRVAQVDPETGEQVRMSDDERVNALQKADQAIKEHCR